MSAGFGNAHPELEFQLVGAALETLGDELTPGQMELAKDTKAMKVYDFLRGAAKKRTERYTSYNEIVHGLRMPARDVNLYLVMLADSGLIEMGLCEVEYGYVFYNPTHAKTRKLNVRTFEDADAKGVFSAYRESLK